MFAQGCTHSRPGTHPDPGARAGATAAAPLAVVDLFDDAAAELPADEFHPGHVGARPGGIVWPLFFGRTCRRPGRLRAAVPPLATLALSAASAPGGPLSVGSVRLRGWPARVSAVRRGRWAAGILAVPGSARLAGTAA